MVRRVPSQSFSRPNQKLPFLKLPETITALRIWEYLSEAWGIYATLDTCRAYADKTLSLRGQRPAKYRTGYDV